MEPMNIIQKAAEECQDLMERVAVDGPAGCRSWSQSRLVDFNLWSAGLGVLAPSKTSLDYRLRNQPEGSQVVSALLECLASVLRNLLTSGDIGNDDNPISPSSWDLDDVEHPAADTQEVSKTSIRPISPWSDVAASSQDVKSALLGVDLSPEQKSLCQDADVLTERLIELGMSIRQSGRSSQLRKADKLFEASHYDSLRRYQQLVLCRLKLLAGLDGTPENSAPKNMNTEQLINFLASSKLSAQQEILVNANLLRRHRFVFARRRAQSLRSTSRPRDNRDLTHDPHDTKEILQSSTSSSIVRAKQESESTEVSEEKAPSLVTTRSRFTESTSASALLETVEVGGFNTPTSDVPECAAFTQVSSETAKILYPKPPFVQKLAKNFCCPCCYQQLHCREARKLPRWKKHLRRDLYPYTCVALECPASDRLFKTERQWKDHLKTSHTVKAHWKCRACNSKTSFPSVAELSEHLHQQHHDSIPSDLLPFVIDLCRSTTIDLPEVCPVCQFCPNNDTTEKFLDHLSVCIHAFSLNALPWTHDPVVTNLRSSLVDTVMTWVSGLEVSVYHTSAENEEHYNPASQNADSGLPSNETIGPISSDMYFEESENDKSLPADQPPDDEVSKEEVYSLLPLVSMLHHLTKILILESGQDAYRPTEDSAFVARLHTNVVSLSSVLYSLSHLQLPLRSEASKAATELLRAYSDSFKPEPPEQPDLAQLSKFSRQYLLAATARCQETLVEHCHLPQMDVKNMLNSYTYRQGKSEAHDKPSMIANSVSRLASKHRNITDWLSPSDPYRDHYNARKRHHPGTGNWLLQSDMYNEWKASANAMLWLTGQPGCGKTVLCSTVIEDLRKQGQGDPASRLAFFYLSSTDLQRQSYSDLLTSLVLQLLHGEEVRSSMQQLVDKVYPSKPSTEQLKDILSMCFQQPGQSVLIIDALDELEISEDEDDISGRYAMIDWLKHVMKCDHQLKIFVTSQLVSDFERSFVSFAKFRVSMRPESINGDISKYIENALEEHPRLRRFSAYMKNRVKKMLVQKSGTSFIWATLQLEELKKLEQTKAKPIEAVLRSVPSTLEATYERILLQIDNKFRDYMLNALRWLSFTSRPLALGELAEAHLIDPKESFKAHDRGQPEVLLKMLDSLVLLRKLPDDRSEDEEVDEYSLPTTYITVKRTEKLSIQFLHYTVKEYLLSEGIKRGRAAYFALREDRDRQIVAQSCLAYLCYYSESPEKTMSKQDLDTFPLLQYAAKEWSILISKKNPTKPGHERRLLQAKGYKRDWLSVYQPDLPNVEPFSEPGPYVGSALYYASLIGIIPLCQELLTQGAEINACDGYYGSALQASSYKGNQEVSRLLIYAGADPNVQGGFYGYALQAAARGGHQEVVHLLLKAGADPNVQGGFYGYALQAAARGGFQDIVQLLLDTGADVNAQAGDYGSALQVAARGGFQGIVQLLLDVGADVNVRGGDNGSALQAAVSRGHQEVVHLLLDAGADVNAQGGKYRNPLEAASVGGHQTIVRLLLDRGADVILQSSKDSNAL